MGKRLGGSAILARRYPKQRARMFLLVRIGKPPKTCPSFRRLGWGCRWPMDSSLCMGAISGCQNLKRREMGCAFIFACLWQVPEPRARLVQARGGLIE